MMEIEVFENSQCNTKGKLPNFTKYFLCLVRLIY